MAIDNRLQVFNEEGQSVDYDILASDVKFNDGKDLPTKLAEMEEEIGEGGYTPPDGGIPKADLAPAVQTSLGLADTALQAADKAQLQTQINNKANSSDLQNYATKSELTSGLSGKQNTLTFDNTPTAGNTDHVVSSSGIRAALDTLLSNIHIGTNGNWYIGDITDPNNDTGVKAQGPAGNVNITDASQLVTILVNDLTTGGAGNILTAEMGKVLKEAVSTLVDSMGEYCFPNGRPTLSWEAAKADIITHFNNSHVTSTNTAQRVDIGASFETTLGTNDNLYVIDDDSVVVKMDGVTQAGAYTAATGKVTIADVTGYIEITANAITYYGYGEQNSHLVAMWDGKNVDSANNQWVDVVGNRVLPLTSCTIQSDHVEFDGTNSEAINNDSSVYVDAEPTTGTIEGVLSHATISSGSYCFVFAQPKTSKRLCIFNIKRSSTTNNYIYAATQAFGSNEPGNPDAWLSPAEPTIKCISLSDTLGVINGASMTRDSDPMNGAATSYSRLSIFSLISSSGSTVRSQGSMYCLRLYNTQLDADKVAHNYKVDQKRFNLS